MSCSKAGPPGGVFGQCLVGCSFRGSPFSRKHLTLYIQKSEDLNPLVSKSEGCWYICLQGIVKKVSTARCQRAGDAPEPIQALQWHVPSGRVYCWYQILDALHITDVAKKRRMLYLTLVIIPSKLSFLLRALPSRACFSFLLCWLKWKMLFKAPEVLLKLCFVIFPDQNFGAEGSHLHTGSSPRAALFPHDMFPARPPE